MSEWIVIEAHKLLALKNDQLDSAEAELAIANDKLRRIANISGRFGYITGWMQDIHRIATEETNGNQDETTPHPRTQAESN